jgi:hypothetical protein
MVPRCLHARPWLCYQNRKQLFTFEGPVAGQTLLVCGPLPRLVSVHIRILLLVIALVIWNFGVVVHARYE